MIKILFFLLILRHNSSRATEPRPVNCVEVANRLSQRLRDQFRNDFIAILHRLNAPHLKSVQLSEAEKSLLLNLGIKESDLPKNPKEIFQYIVQHLKKNKTSYPLAIKALETYQHHLLRNVTESISSINTEDTSLLTPLEDHNDTLRGYGYLLLPRDDIAFQAPSYVASLIRQRAQTATGFPNFDPSRSQAKFRSAFGELSRGLNHRVVPVAFTLGGSDANTLFTEIADWVVSLKHGFRKDGKVLYFEDNYIASRGPLKKFRFFDRGEHKGPWSDYLIPSPLVNYPPRTEDLKLPLNEAEEEALNAIRKKFENGNIGGIQIETIPSARGVYFYRSNFLVALKKLSSELQIPLLADEIFNGGGRTGKPFGYLHYPDFVPDFVTFGKGVGTAGLAEVQPLYKDTPFDMRNFEAQINSNLERYSLALPFRFFESTIQNTADGFLKSSAILRRILNDKLMDNATTIGPYYAAQIARFRKDFLNWEQQTDSPQTLRQIGLLIGLNEQSRVIAPITLQKKDVDLIIKNRILEVLYEGMEQDFFVNASELNLESLKERIKKLESAEVIDWTEAADLRRIIYQQERTVYLDF